ncbi:MAG: multicopper oxidase domain-containing protein [Saprospiraceae bacterium]
MKKIIYAAIFFTSSWVANTQGIIQIPPLLYGPDFELTIQQGTSEIYQGFKTATIGYNGSQLGPTLVLKKGESISLHVHNQLHDTTTTHWHGLHVAPINDGSPHNFILAGDTWSPSFDIKDNSATYWYHPHLHGKTLNQVVKGAAGLIIVQDPEESALSIPRTYGIDDVPLIFQWKTFDNAKQIIELDELDNEVLVNGALRGSTLNLPAQIVRLRLLNGSSHRYFNFGFNNSMSFKQIAGDAGLLDSPVELSKLILAPGERAEILVDFTGKKGEIFMLRQLGSQLPQGYPGGTMMMMGSSTLGPLDNKDFDILKINITSPTTNPIVSIPDKLTLNKPYSQTGAGIRNFGLTALPMMSMNNFFINGLKYNMERIDFIEDQGKTEVWTITNQTMMSHPFHIHGNSFYILSINGSPPPTNVRGKKDVVTIPPMNGNAKIIIRFDDFSDQNLPYMYHCHILSHEDMGMMGQFLVTSKITNTKEPTRNNSCLICYSSLPIPSDIDPSRIARTDIYDFSGKFIQSFVSSISVNQSFEVSTLSAGFYIGEMRDREGKILTTQRFIKK